MQIQKLYIIKVAFLKSFREKPISFLEKMWGIKSVNQTGSNNILDKENTYINKPKSKIY